MRIACIVRNVTLSSRTMGPPPLSTPPEGRHLGVTRQLPLHMSYRAVGSSSGMNEFVGQASNGYEPYTHFGAGDIPITGELFSALQASASPTKTLLHIPIALGCVPAQPRATSVFGGRATPGWRPTRSGTTNPSRGGVALPTR